MRPVVESSGGDRDVIAPDDTPAHASLPLSVTFRIVFNSNRCRMAPVVLAVERSKQAGGFCGGHRCLVAQFGIRGIRVGVS